MRRAKSIDVQGRLAFWRVRRVYLLDRLEFWKARGRRRVCVRVVADTSDFDEAMARVQAVIDNPRISVPEAVSIFIDLANEAANEPVRVAPSQHASPPAVDLARAPGRVDA